MTKCKCGCKEELKEGKTSQGNLRKYILGHSLISYIKQNQKHGKEHHNWKGGRILIDGYYYIHSPNHPNKYANKYILEHRLVMEKHIGRYLTRTEIIHHKDRNTLNNKINNLSLIKNISEHNKLHPRSRKNGKFIKK